MKIYDAADFGRAVRTFRKAKGYTQQQIADLSGCSLMFVSNLERGKETAELGKALAVLATIGVDVRADARGVPIVLSIDLLANFARWGQRCRGPRKGPALFLFQSAR